MSRAYKVNITGLNLNLHIDKDKVVQDIELLPILTLPRMKEMLKKRLVENGGTEEGQLVIIDKGKVRFTYDLENLKVEISLNLSEIKAEGITIEEERLPKKARVEEGVAILSAEDIKGLSKDTRKIIENQIKALEKNTVKEAELLLLKEVLNARQILNTSLKEVYKEAIKEKAASLGNITSISESDQNGEFRLRLEIQ